MGHTVSKEAHIKSPADVDPATSVHDDAAAVLKASKEPDFFQLPDEVTALISQSQMAPAAQMSSNPRSWSGTSSPVMTSSSISLSPITTAATLLRESAFISPQSEAQDIEMDTNPDLQGVLWGDSSDNHTRSLNSTTSSSPAISGINNDYFCVNVDNSSFDMDVDFLHSQWPDFSGTESNSSWNTGSEGGDLSQFMQALGLSDMLAPPDRSAQIVAESPSMSSGTSSDSLNLAPSDQLAADAIRHENELAADCHMTTTPTSDLCSTLSAPPALPNVENLPRQARQCRAPPPKEVITLCGAKKDLGPPQWHQESLTAMRDQSLGPAWLSLVEKWYKLESDMWKVKATTEVYIPHSNSIILTDRLVG